MNIERDPAGIQFHKEGTLTSITQWISNHAEGIAEWLKNVRRAYQADRSDVKQKHRVAVLCFKDASGDDFARIALLDVGGANLEDVEAWSTWQDPYASNRQKTRSEDQEITQGNGGKAYMFRMFTGLTRMLGVSEGKRNCKGFDGIPGSVDRGWPGYIPNIAAGREVTIASVEAEARKVLEPYGIKLSDLPKDMQNAINARQAFTLVEGHAPVGMYKNKIDAEDLMAKVLRHEQATLAVEQLDLYGVHNGCPMNDGKPYKLPTIEAMPLTEGPFVYKIPEDLPLQDGEPVSTTDNGKKQRGRLTLLTSRENMPNAYRKLKSRWVISYWANPSQNIGSKPISDFTPGTPGSKYIYGIIELPALDPGYVDLGRRRPKDGPLTEALDLFISNKIREIAKDINQRRKRELDDKALIEVGNENDMLDRFKNKYLASDGSGDGAAGDDGVGPKDHERETVEYGEVPEVVELSIPDGGITIGNGAYTHIQPILGMRIFDSAGRPVRAKVTWKSQHPTVARFVDGDWLEARHKGETEIWAEVKVRKGPAIQSARVPIVVWQVDHVLLTPRTLEIPLGRRQQIVADVTNDEGERSTNVFLEWKHDADDQLVVMVGSRGYVTGNRIGRTAVSAGAGIQNSGGVWSRLSVDVTVVMNPEALGKGAGFPRLLLTGRDVDPATNEIREGDPDSPALWQEASDFRNNIWWLNLQSPEANYAFAQRAETENLWRQFHAQVVMEMVVQVHMQVAYTKKGDNEKPEYWGPHKAALDRNKSSLVQQMWPELEKYVAIGGGLG